MYTTKKTIGLLFAVMMIAALAGCSAETKQAPNTKLVPGSVDFFVLPEDRKSVV